MKPEEIAELILEGHRTRQKNVFDVQGFRLDLQLDYSGLVAKGAYNGWKLRRNHGRGKVGCFDFQIYRIDGPQEIPMNHVRIVKRAPEHLSIERIEEVFVGNDPWEVGHDRDEIIALQEIQLAMLEQEINWGDESFQSWSRFSPSERKRPRDYLMAYLRRIFKEPDSLGRIEKMKAAAGTWGVLPPPVGKKEWRNYLEPTSSNLKPWIAGKILEKFRKVSEHMPDNPYYQLTYRE